MDVILAASPTDFARALAEIRAVRARAWRLEQRARILKQPVNAAYEQISSE